MLKKLILPLLVGLMATAAQADDPNDPNILGVYFDTGANSDCTTVPPFVPAAAYVILSNSTFTAIDAYEFGYSITASGLGDPGLNFQRLLNQLPGGGHNSGDASNPRLGDYVVSLETPLVTGWHTVLVTWRFLWTSPMEVNFYLRPANAPSLPSGLPAVSVDGAFYPLAYARNPNGYTATINGECICATEPANFGSVKSLFR